MIIQQEYMSGWLLYILQTVMLVAIICLIGVGADWLVTSACRIARFFGVSYLVIGLTVVAFGTSAPEMAASLVAGFKGNVHITVANVVGSNIFNQCFILGSVVLIVKGIKVDRELFTRDGPILIAGTILLFFFIGSLSTQAPVETSTNSSFLQPLNMRLEWGEGLILVSLLIVYLYVLYRTGKSESEEDENSEKPAQWFDAVFFLAGLALVVGGCHFLVGDASESNGIVKGYGALWFARLWQIPDHVIGGTIVAAGTSAPEFVISLVAARKGAVGLSAGNLLGSDIFNLFAIVGVAGLVLQPPLAGPVEISAPMLPGLLGFTLIVMITTFFMWTGSRISRKEGAILLSIGVLRWIFEFVS